MAGSAIDWPPLEGLVAFVKKHGQSEAARRLGVSRSSLQGHLDRNDVPAEDRRPPKRTLNEDALKELRELID